MAEVTCHLYILLSSSLTFFTLRPAHTPQWRKVSSPRLPRRLPPPILLLASSASPARPPQIPPSRFLRLPRPRSLFLRLRATGGSASSSQISPPPAPGLSSASSDVAAGVVEAFPVASEGEGDLQPPVSSDAAAGVVEASAEPTDASPEDLDNIREVLELLQKNRDMTFG